MPIDKNRKVLTDILSWLFATPAALSILAKMSDRLDLSERLERAILNFKRISEYVWEKASKYFDIDLSGVYEILTFTACLLVPLIGKAIFALLRYLLITRKLSNTDKEDLAIATKKSCGWNTHTFMLATSYVFILFIAMLFNVYLYIITAVVILGSYLIFVKHDKSFITGDKVEDIKRYNVIVISLCLLVSIIAAILVTLVLPPDLSEMQKIMVILFILFCLLLIALSTLYCADVLARIALWVLGILIINYIANSIIPGIDAFMDRALFTSSNTTINTL